LTFEDVGAPCTSVQGDAVLLWERRTARSVFSLMTSFTGRCQDILYTRWERVTEGCGADEPSREGEDGVGNREC
jgi:hypothetical protein